jgi:hypothetical protein
VLPHGAQMKSRRPQISTISEMGIHDFLLGPNQLSKYVSERLRDCIKKGYCAESKHAATQGISGI